MESKYNGLVLGEEHIILCILKSVRMLSCRLKLEEIDYVDETDLDLGQFCIQDGNCCKSLKGRGLTCAGKYDIGFLALIVGSPIPDADTLRAMLNCFCHGQPLRTRVLGSNDHVHIVAAADAVVKAGKQAV